MLNCFKTNRFCILIICCFIGFYFSSLTQKTAAENSKEILIENKLFTCHMPLIEPWQRIPAVFGFSSLLFQINEQKERATFGLIITGLMGSHFESDDFKKEIQSFLKAKRDYVENEIGGTYLRDGESLIAEGVHKTYRLTYDYKDDDGLDYRESTYFRFVNNHLVHAKLLYPIESFNSITIEQQILNLMAGLSCK